MYSICINVVNADQWLRLNAVNSGTTNVEYKNDFVKMYSGALFLNSWGSKTMFPGFVPENWMVYKFGCISDSIHQLTKLKPTPGGTELKKGQIFQSNFPNTTGTISDPDIVAAYDTFSYVFNPPNGFFNTGYASKWTISKIVLRTRTGKIVPKGWTYVLPFSGNDGVVFLVLDSQWIDTPLVLNLFLRDLGPYFCDTLLTRYIFLTMRPKLSFKANPAAICDGDAVLFENSSTISSGYIKYFWDFGTGNPADTSNAVSPVFKFPKYGTYYVKLKGTSVPYGYVSTKTVKVIVNEIPNVKFDRTNACEGQDVVLTNKTTMSTPQTITYLWDLGDGVRKTTKDVLYRYAKTGGYLVALTATSNGCSNTSFKNVYQFSKPNASFLVSGTLFCSLRDVVFLNISTINSGIAGSNWIFGDGDISTDDNPLHSFKSEGDFNVKLIMVSEFGCKDSFSKKLKINEIPKADFTNLQPCDQKPTTFNNKTIYSPLNLPNYKWDFGDTTSSTQTNPMKFWNTLGPKIVRLSAYSFNGCADSITKKLTIIPQPTVDFDIFDQCSGKNVQINNKTFIKQGNLVYEWKFGDGRTSNDRIPGLQYNISSTITFNVSLKSYVNIGCSDSVTKSVTISENPNCSFIAEREWTLGNRGMKFKPANTSYSSYFWQFGDGGSSSTTSPKYKYLYDFDFPVTLTIKNSAGCDCKLTKNVKVDAKTGLFTQENERLNIFTDHNSLYIDAHKNSYKNGILQLTDMQGTKVFLESFKVLKGKNSINLSHLSSGIYNVQFTSGDFSQIAKIIIP